MIAGGQVQTHHDGCWENPQHHACAAARVRELTESVRELMFILETTEESDEGHVFHPTVISCCRTETLLKLTKTIDRLKDLSK